MRKTTRQAVSRPPSLVALDRRFVPAREEAPDELDILAEVRASSDALSWGDLLSRRRVVVLAEAGSGKSTELEEQARRQQLAGRYTFAATVQNVGHLGLDDALRAHAQQLANWRASGDPAWFFLDSIDEAKDRNVPLKEALDQVALGIAGCEGRAHIVLSGRHGDWEFRRDLERLATILPVPPEDRALAPLDPNEHAVKLMRREKIEAPAPAEAALVVLMAALDRDQVETFARAKGIAAADAFLRALDQSDLWRFARRPLDLEWLVDYWREHGAFGTLAQMLDGSLRHRLREPDLQRARSDALKIDDAIAALERIGAALTLQQQQYILLPDTALALPESRSGLDLRALLQDWAEGNQIRLLNRAVFDPVVAGLVRLHLDNEGVVRSFLAARWLKRLLDHNCPHSTILDILFAATYDIDVVIPSMRQTAAWLSLWDADIARHVIAHDPLLLMAHGDPASLSLEMRERVLRAVVQRVHGERDFDRPGRDNLQRFARADLAPAIREAWRAHGDSPAVRELLLLMIWLGAIRDCADLAIGASFGQLEDRTTQLYAGRALMAVASAADRQRYLDYLLANTRTIPAALVSDAIDELFPAPVSVDQLLQLLASVDLRHGAHRIDYLLAKLPERLNDVGELQRLNRALLSKVDQSEDAETDLDDTVVSAIAAASRRELEISPPARISGVAIEGALLAIARERRRQHDPELLRLLLASPERRRAVLYRAASWFATAPGLHGQPISEVWQFQIAGLPLALERADMGWLLEDADQRAASDERELAADAWMDLAHQARLEEPDLAPLRAVAARHPEVAAVLERWARSRTSESPERASTRALRRIEKRNAIEQAQQDEYWRAFAEQIRSNPAQLRALPPPTNKTMDRRLYRLWQLLSTAGENHSRYAIDDLDALAPIFDENVRAAIRDAFTAFWRHWPPKLRSERPAAERQALSNFDLVGMVGVALEAAADAGWATRLTREEALRATRYATLEINGFPHWVSALAAAHPEAMREVLAHELAFELSDAAPEARPETLEQIARAGVAVGALVVDQLYEHLRAPTLIPWPVLQASLRVLATSMADLSALERLLVERIRAETRRGVLALYFEYLFRLAPPIANAALEKKLATLDDGAQTLLVQAVLPRLAADDLRDQADAMASMPLATLERLVRIAYRTIRMEDDNDHSDGESYTPDERDDAESARSALFRHLVDTPGRATLRALQALMNVRDFPIPIKRLAALCKQRAAEDSEHAAWSSDEVRRFEHDHTVVPHTPVDLQRLVLRRIDDLQHQLLHAEYGQGSTLAALPSERDVQRWLADRFEHAQSRSYSVERESVVIEEKAPDVRFRAKASTASVPLEIKVAESWGFKDLQDALETQLVKQYLRDRTNRFGILLLVHQTSRLKGWTLPKRKSLKITDVVSRLRARAATIAATEPLAPQPAVALLDVSSSYRAPSSRPKESPAKQKPRRGGAVQRAAVKRSKVRPASTKKRVRPPPSRSRRGVKKGVQRTPKHR